MSDPWNPESPNPESQAEPNPDAAHDDSATVDKVARSPQPPQPAPPATRERGENLVARGTAPQPGLKAIEKAREARFGKGPGAVHVDSSEGRTYLVFVDREGKEVGRERYVPEDKAKA